MTKWQYTSLQIITRGLGDETGAGDLEAALNRLGADDWELVSSTLYHNAEASADVVLMVFRKPAGPPTALRALGTGRHVPQLEIKLPEQADGAPGEPANRKQNEESSQSAQSDRTAS